MDKELVFIYQPEKEDYINASRTLALKTPFFMIVSLLILLLVVASIVVLAFPSLGDPSWRSAAFVGLAMGAFYLLNFLVIIPYQLSNTYKRNESLRKERSLSLGDTGVSLKIGDRSTEFSWEHFQKVLERDGFFLMIYKAKERVYPFLPERAFTDENSKSDFLAVLESKGIPVK